MLIAIIGMDGSGKTVISKKVAKRLEAEGRLVKLLHIDSYFLLQPVLNLVNKGTDSGNKFLTTEDKPFLVKLWPLGVIIDNFIRYLYFSLLRFGGYTVVCDRYFYDKLLGFEYFGYTTPLISRLYLALTPPAKTIFLDVSPETASSRESGDTHTEDFFFKMSDHYRKLAGDKNFVCINAEKPLGEVVEEVMGEVLKD